MKQPPELRIKKKPYESPKLLVYGNLTQMTRAVGQKGNPDGGTSHGKQRSGR